MRLVRVRNVLAPNQDFFFWMLGGGVKETLQGCFPPMGAVLGLAVGPERAIVGGAPWVRGRGMC